MSKLIEIIEELEKELEESEVQQNERDPHSVN